MCSISCLYPTLPTFKEWEKSRYAIDDNDHSGRLICLIDITSQIYNMIKGIVLIVMDLFKGLGAFLAMLFLLPCSYISKTARDFKASFVPFLTDNLFSPGKNNERAFFFLITIPKQIMKIVCNAIGLIFPEAGRFGRRIESPQLPHDDTEVIPSFEEWKTSTYKIDDKDHTGRFICIADILAQGWQLVTGAIFEVAIPLIKGVLAFIASIILVPLDQIASFCGCNKITSLKNEVITIMIENLQAAPCNAVMFLTCVVPQTFLKVCGNAVGVVFPEVGRYMRKWEKLKLRTIEHTPPSKAEPLPIEQQKDTPHDSGDPS